MSKEVLLRKLQALNLIAVDLQLFLDTHPGNKEALEDYEYPVDIRVIEERPYFHFKTNRKELTEAILAENN